MRDPLQAIDTRPNRSATGTRGPSPVLARWALLVTLVGTYATLTVTRTLTNALRSANLLRWSVAALFGAACVVAVLLLRRQIGQFTWRLGVVVAAVLATYAAVIWPLQSPEEKVHFLQYGLIAVLAQAALPVRWSTTKRACVAAAFTGCAGWLDEGIQYLLPSRFYDLRDVGFNALAGVMALTAVAAIRWAGR